MKLINNVCGPTKDPRTPTSHKIACFAYLTLSNDFVCVCVCVVSNDGMMSEVFIA